MYTVYCTFIFSTVKTLYTNYLKFYLTVKKKKKKKNKKIKHTKAAKYSVSDSLPPFDLITYKIEPVTFNYVLIRFKLYDEIINLVNHLDRHSLIRHV